MTTKTKQSDTTDTTSNLGKENTFSNQCACLRLSHMITIFSLLQPSSLLMRVSRKPRNFLGRFQSGTIIHTVYCKLNKDGSNLVTLL